MIGLTSTCYDIIVSCIILSHFSFPVHPISSVIHVIFGHPFWAGTITICYDIFEPIQSS